MKQLFSAWWFKICLAALGGGVGLILPQKYTGALVLTLFMWLAWDRYRTRHWQKLLERVRFERRQRGLSSLDNVPGEDIWRRQGQYLVVSLIWLVTGIVGALWILGVGR